MSQDTFFDLDKNSVIPNENYGLKAKVIGIGEQGYPLLMVYGLIISTQLKIWSSTRI